MNRRAASRAGAFFEPKVDFINTITPAPEKDQAPAGILLDRYL
jgi:hypothetical protein